MICLLTSENLSLSSPESLILFINTLNLQVKATVLFPPWGIIRRHLGSPEARKHRYISGGLLHYRTQKEDRTLVA